MRVIMIIAQKNFRDEELFDTKSALASAGIEVKIAAPELATAFGKLGAAVEPDFSISEIEPQKFDAVVLVGGSGAADFIDDKKIQNLAREFYDRGKIVAAICIAPAILARAGLLSGHRATCHGYAENYLREAGAEFTAEDVERDAQIITANGPASASLFGRAIVEALKS